MDRALLLLYWQHTRKSNVLDHMTRVSIKGHVTFKMDMMAI